ncbi:MAG TPA: hypothetical protein VK171_09260, partial [Fimbriimonas sp.]|nr:hypothetical protein [Fimbriimonas sp.]
VEWRMVGDVLANLSWHPWSGGFFAVAFLLVVFTKPRVAQFQWPSLFARTTIFVLGMWFAVALMVGEFNGSSGNIWSALVSLVTSFGISAFSPKRAQVLRFLATWAMLWALPFWLLPMVAGLIRSRLFDGYGFGGIVWLPVFVVGAFTFMCLNELERVKWGADEPEQSQPQP